MKLINTNLISVIIGYKRRPLAEDIDLISKNRGQIKYIFTIVNAISARIPKETLDVFKRNPNVEYIELDEKVFKHDSQISPQSQKIIGKIYKMNVSQGQIIPWGIEKINAINVHTYTKGLAVKIAILDTGIDYKHQDLSPNYKGGYNFVADNDNPMDDNSHGTHVAGIISAADNNIGIIGVAPSCYLYSVKVLDNEGGGYTSDVVAGIQWSINNNMRIANMSFGSDTYSITLKNACDNAYNQGLLLVAAAGNSGNMIGTGNNIDYPARYDSVIAVVATDISDNRGIFSSTGPKAELAAPGVNILSTLPDNSYGMTSGTSMASPHVAGTAALIIATYPEFINIDTRIRIQITTTYLGNHDWYGYGLINALRSISL